MAKATDGVRKKDGFSAAFPLPAGFAPAPKKFSLPDAPKFAPPVKVPAPEESISAREPASGFLEKFGNKSETEGILITEELEALEAGDTFFHGAWSWATGISRFGWSIIAGILAVLILTVLLSTVFARVTVTYVSRIEAVPVPDTLLAIDSSSNKPNFPQHVIPAEHLQFSRSFSEKFPSSGKMALEEKARGKVKLYNSFSSSPQTLVERTRFVTDSGILFRLAKTVVIPGAQIAEGKIVPRFLEVDLIADGAGEAGNIGANATLKIPGFKGSPKFDGFYAEALAPFSGGFKGEAKVVSADDIKRAQEETTSRVYRDLEEEMARKIPPEFTLLAPLREIQIAGVDAPKEKTRHDEFTAEARAQGSAIIFRKEDILEFMKTFLPLEGKELQEDKTTYELRIKNVDFQKGRADVILLGNASVKSVVPAKPLAEDIAGKKEGTLVDTLKQRKDLSSFRVSFFPPWLMTAPAGDKIRVYEENTE